MKKLLFFVGMALAIGYCGNVGAENESKTESIMLEQVSRRAQLPVPSPEILMEARLERMASQLILDAEDVQNFLVVYKSCMEVYKNYSEEMKLFYEENDFWEENPLNFSDISDSNQQMQDFK